MLHDAGAKEVHLRIASPPIKYPDYYGVDTPNKEELLASKNNLEEIAYKLSVNMLSSIEANSDNIIYGPQIASAYIYNNNFESAVNWIELYENAKEVDSKSIYARVLLDLYSSNDLNSFINSLNLTLSTYVYDQDIQNTELLYVLKSVMNLDITSEPYINYNKIFAYKE